MINNNKSVQTTVLNAALAYELHDHKGDQWKRVFKQALNDLPVKSGKVYRFYVAMSEQSRDGMEKVVMVLNREI